MGEGSVGVGGISKATFTQLGKPIREPIGEQGCGQQNAELPDTQGRPRRRKSTRGQRAEDPDGIEAGTNSVVLLFVLAHSLGEPLAMEAKRKGKRRRGWEGVDV